MKPFWCVYDEGGVVETRMPLEWSETVKDAVRHYIMTAVGPMDKALAIHGVLCRVNEAAAEHLKLEAK